MTLRSLVDYRSHGMDTKKSSSQETIVELSSLKNVARNALKPQLLPGMVRKVWLRFKEPSDDGAMKAWRDQLQKDVIDAGDWAQSLNSALWTEALAFDAEQTTYSDGILKNIPVKMGGGGFYALLYFMTRHLKPKIVVETGVAAGFSSRAFITALEQNGQGELFSSDFPYFRIKDPEQYIGILVEPERRARWKLDIRGDRIALPNIAATVPHIDLLHYDSDKSMNGRDFALDTLSSVMSDQSVILFDDIQDNLHFKLVDPAGWQKRVFTFGDKYIGLMVRPGHPLAIA